VVDDRDHATGRLPLRSDLRLPDGPRAAPVAIAMLDTAGINVDAVHLLALVRADVQLLPTAATADAIAVQGRIVREARTMVFTEARLVDAGDHDRVLGHGTADWVVVAPTPPGFAYVDPGDGVPDVPPMPPLWEVYGAEARAGGGFEIAALSPRVGGELLHHGPTLVVTEAAAVQAVERAAGAPVRAIESMSTRLVRGGTVGPFRTQAEVLGDALCRVELHDIGADALIATTVLRARL
jgi:acyl-coenzyme A thioesterase PaaI-like protein